MSLHKSPAFTAYEPVPTTSFHRREAVALHVPADERLKPEMLRFIDGTDRKARPHLTATAQAIARAEMRVHEAYQARMLLAERMYRIWTFLALWTTFEGRSIEWIRPKRKPHVWRARASQQGKVVAQASGKEPFDVAQLLAEKLRLL